MKRKLLSIVLLSLAGLLSAGTSLAGVNYKVSMLQGLSPQKLGDIQTTSTHYRTRAKFGDNALQQILVAEGKTAFIEAGQQFPVVDQASVGFGFTGISERQRQVVTGFYVKVTANKDNSVQVELSRERGHVNQLNQPSERIAKQMTTVNVPLGQWTLIGDSNQAHFNDPNARYYRAGKLEQDHSALYLRVDVVNNQLQEPLYEP